MAGVQRGVALKEQGPGGREGSGKEAEQFKMADRLMTDQEQS